MDDQRPIVYEKQIAGMRLMGLGDKAEAYIRAHFDVVPNPVVDTNNVVARLNDIWRRAELERLGSLDNVFKPRMAQDTEVPKLRGLSYGPHSVYIDEANCITERDSRYAYWRSIPESDPVQLKEWVQRRGICRRTLSCGIS